MTKKKSKKQKKPNIPIQTTARPRLEQVLTRYQHHELDHEEFIASIEALMAEIGRDAVLNALVGLLDNATNEQKDALMVAIPKLGNADTIKHLWQLVRKSKLSVTSKMTALVILKQMGEDVNLDDPGEYLSWRDVKHTDLAEVEDLARFGLRAIIKELLRTKNVDDTEGFMLHYAEMIPEKRREKTVLAQIDTLIEMGDSEAADMLAAISATTPYPQVRQAARTGLLKLSAQKVFPQSEIIKSLRDERFYAAYSTDPAHPWQQGVIMVWERPQNTVQAIVFLRDFGSPWKGGIKDLFPTFSMPWSQMERELIHRDLGMDVGYRRVTYARARQFILDAIEAHEKNRVKFPPEYEEFRHLIERRIIDPSAQALAYADQVDARTIDEWGELAGEPVRGREIIGPDGTPIPVISIGDLEDWEGEDYELTFDDLMDEVEQFYFPDDSEEEEDVDEDEAEELVPIELMVDYLTTRHKKGLDIEELGDRWDSLAEFLLYLEEAYDPDKTLADIQGYHLSEFIAEYWDESVFSGETTSIEEKEAVIDAVQDLYDYLARQKHIPRDAAKRVNKAAAILFSQPGKITPIPS